MSAEIDADVAQAYREARNVIEGLVNERLSRLALKTKCEKWAVIAIIRKDENPDYCEIRRYDTRRRVLEFRLKLNHSDFLSGNSQQQKALVLDLLKRTVGEMPGFQVMESDCRQLLTSLEEVGRTL